MSFFRFLDRPWRIFATGICFAFFSLGGLIMSTTLFPLIHMLPGGQRRNTMRVRFAVHKTFQLFVGMMSFFGLIRVHWHNLELLRSARACLVIANHPTLIDVVILISQIPHANGIVKGELFRNPWLKRVVSNAGFISNESGEQMLAESAEALAAGDAIVIFPEGSRTVPLEGLQFRRGTANIALRAEVPLLSVFITCKPITLVKGEAWYKIPERRAEIDIWVKEWLNPAQLAGGEQDISLAVRRMTLQLQEYYTEGLKIYE